MQGKIIKQLFENPSEQDKKIFIDSIIKKQEKAERIISQHKAKCCPHCNSTSFKKNGTFFSLSFKGNYKNFSLPRLAKKRRGNASKRGLSREKVCIPCVVDHNGLFSRNRCKLGAFNIQTINSYQSRLKVMITYNFRRVSTKHFNNYLIYHNFVNFAKESQKEKEVVLLDFIQKTYCKSLVKNISNRSAIAV